MVPMVTWACPLSTPDIVKDNQIELSFYMEISVAAWIRVCRASMQQKSPVEKESVAEDTEMLISYALSY